MSHTKQSETWFYPQKHQPGSPNHHKAEKDEVMVCITGSIVIPHSCPTQMVVGREWCHLHAAHWGAQSWVVPHPEQSTGTQQAVFWHLTTNKTVYIKFVCVARCSIHTQPTVCTELLWPWYVDFSGVNPKHIGVTKWSIPVPWCWGWNQSNWCNL